MTRLIILSFTILCCFSSFKCLAQKYDPKLADSLGADPFGMKHYTLVILKTGASTISDQEELQKIFRGHLDNVHKLMEEKKLIVVGPLAANSNDYRGIFILDLPENELAQDVMKSDPGVTSGIFDVEYYDFYSSAALSMYLPFHKQIQKSKP